MMNMRWGHRGSRGASSVVCSNGQRRGNSTTSRAARARWWGWVGGVWMRRFASVRMGTHGYASVRVGARRCAWGLWGARWGWCGSQDEVAAVWGVARPWPPRVVTITTTTTTTAALSRTKLPVYIYRGDPCAL